MGDIVFGLGPDTARMRAAMRDIQQFGATVEQVASTVAQSATAQENAYRRQEAAIVSASNRYQSFVRLAQQTQAPPQLITGMQQAFVQLSNTMTNGLQSTLAYQRANQLFTVNLNASKAALQQHMMATQQAAGPVGALATQMASLAHAASLITGPLSGVASRLNILAGMMSNSTLGAAALVSGMAAAAYGFIRLAEGAIHTEEHLTAVRNQLFAVTGSMAVANFEMGRLMDVSNRSGVAFVEVAEHFARIEIAARGTKLEGERVRDMFGDLIAYGGSLSLSQEKMTTILNNVERSLSRGLIQWRDIRQELNREIPNATNIAIKALGVTREQFDLMATRGQLVASEFWPKFAKQLLDSSGIDATKTVDNLIASHNKLKNSVTEFSNALDKTLGFSASYKRTLDTIAAALDYMAQHMDMVVKVAGTVAAAMAGFLAPQIITGLMTFTVWLTRATLAMVGLNVAMLANPAGMILRLAGAALAAAAGWKYFNDAVSTSKDGLIGAVTGSDEYLRSQERMRTGTVSATRAFIEQEQAMKNNRQQMMDTHIGNVANFDIGDTLVNNIMSIWNDLIRLGREKGIDTAIEFLQWFAKTMAEGVKDFIIDPAIQAFEKIKQAARDAANSTATDYMNAFSKGVFSTVDTLIVNPVVDGYKKIKGFTAEEGKKSAEEFVGATAEFMAQNTEKYLVTPMVNAFTVAAEFSKEAIAKGNSEIEQQQRAHYRKMEEDQRRSVETIAKLQALLKKQQADEGNRKDESNAENDRQKRIRLALADLERFEKESNQRFNAMKEGPQALRDMLVSIDIEKSVEGWRDKLEHAGLTAGEAAGHLKTLTKTITDLKKAEEADKNFKSFGQFLSDSFAELGKTGVSKFVDALNQAKLSMQTLRDVAFSVISDMEKKFLELALINPLLNMLFGGGAQVFTMGSPGTGTGGLFGMLSGGSARTHHSGSGSFTNRFVDSGVFSRAPRLHFGLMPDEFPAILQHGEEVIPKGGRSGGNTYAIESHIHYAGPPPTDPGANHQIVKAQNRMLKDLIDSRISDSMRPGGMASRGRS